MVGLIVLAVVVVYIAFWWFVFRNVKRGWPRVVVILVALAIPFWDLPYGYLNFHLHCQREGGVHLAGKIPKPQSVLIDKSAGYRPEHVLNLGFKMVEYQEAGRITRYATDGKALVKSQHEAPLSGIRIAFSGHKREPANLVRSEEIVSKVDSGEVVARQIDFRWLGTWWQVWAAPMFGTGPRCLPYDQEPLLRVLVRG